MVSTLAASYLSSSARSASRKEAKYTSLTNSYIFQPIAVESHGAFSASALSFLTTLGEGLTGTSDDLQEMSYLFQRLLLIMQRFNSVFIHESFVFADEEPDLWPFQVRILASLVVRQRDLTTLGTNNNCSLTHSLYSQSNTPSQLFTVCESSISDARKFVLVGPSLKFGAEVRNCIWCLRKSTYT